MEIVQSHRWSKSAPGDEKPYALRILGSRLEQPGNAARGSLCKSQQVEEAVEYQCEVQLKKVGLQAGKSLKP